MRELRLIRRDAQVQRDQARLMRHRAARQRRHANTTLERMFAAEILAMLSEPDLADLEEVTPHLRLIRGGRG
jgi:hypothetical protein